MLNVVQIDWRKSCVVEVRRVVVVLTSLSETVLNRSLMGEGDGSAAMSRREVALLPRCTKVWRY